MQTLVHDSTVIPLVNLNILQPFIKKYGGLMQPDIFDATFEERPSLNAAFTLPLGQQPIETFFVFKNKLFIYLNIGTNRLLSDYWLRRKDKKYI